MNGDEMEDFLGGLMIYETIEDGRSCYQSEILWILANKIKKLEMENEKLSELVERNRIATGSLINASVLTIGSRDARRIMSVLMGVKE